MMRKVGLLCMLVGLILLVACASGDDVATAVDYLNALEEGDADTATDLVCPERADTIMSGLMGVSEEERESFSFENISCAARGGNVACSYTISQATVAAATPQEFNRDVVFEFENGLICGFEEEID